MFIRENYAQKQLFFWFLALYVFLFGHIIKINNLVVFRYKKVKSILNQPITTF